MSGTRKRNSDDVLIGCINSMRNYADVLERVVNGEITMVQAAKLSGAENSSFRRALRFFMARNAEEKVPKNIFIELTPQEKLFESITGISSKSDDFYKEIPEDFVQRVENYCSGKCCTLTDKERGIIKNRFCDGATLKRIGDDLGVSRQRAYDIVTKSLMRMRFKAGIDYRYLTGEIDDARYEKSNVVVNANVFGEIGKRAKECLLIFGATTDDEIANVDCRDIGSLTNVGISILEEIACKLIENGYTECRFLNTYALLRNRSKYSDTVPVGTLIELFSKLDPETRIKRTFYGIA